MNREYCLRSYQTNTASGPLGTGVERCRLPANHDGPCGVPVAVEVQEPEKVKKPRLRKSKK